MSGAASRKRLEVSRLLLLKNPSLATLPGCSPAFTLSTIWNCPTGSLADGDQEEGRP